MDSKDSIRTTSYEVTASVGLDPRGTTSDRDFVALDIGKGLVNSGFDTEHEEYQKNTLTFSGCSFKVKVNQKWFDRSSGEWKQILHAVHGQVRGGTDLAIMGPSGCGKTTLLNLLALVPSSASTEGNVTLNGHRINDRLFKKYCAYVPQEDHLWPFLTCRETLLHAADFHLDMPAQSKQDRVDRLIVDLGLEKCRDTICGNMFIKGLSGGQKRRLSLGLALIKEPVVLFLDEPTSGLDSAATTEIMAVLKKVVREQNIVVICTIHQPSTAVFYQFDSVMLLSGGKLAFCGHTKDAIPYFTKDLKKDMPEGVSPPEFLLDLVNCDFGGAEKKQQVQELADGWKDRTVGEEAAEVRNQPHDLPSAGCAGISFPMQVWMQLRRQALLAVRDPTLYASRMAMFLVSCIFFAWVYDRERSRNQTQVTNRMFLLVWFIGVPSCMGAIAVFALNMEFAALKREIKNGMYSPWAYLISNAVLQVPFMLLLTLSALGVAGYGIGNFQAGHLGLMIIIYAVALWTWEMMAQAFSVVFENPLIGMLMYINLWFTSFLFCGFFLPESDVEWPLKIFIYVLPFRWCMASIVKTEFKGTTFEGAFPVADPPPGMPPYGCDNGTAICFGYTGDQVLGTISKTFPLFEPSETFTRDVLCTLAIGVFFKLLFMLTFYRKTLNGAQVVSPDKARSTSCTWPDTAS